jgi:hypothetical protein
MSNNQPFHKVIVFDTDRYAGNFEREMCAYVSGQYGECEVGRELAESVLPTLKHRQWYEEHVVSEPDEHGCWRPTSIWPTPGDNDPEHPYESVAIFVDEFPPVAVLAEMIARARAYCTLATKHALGLYVEGPRYLRGLRFFAPSYRLDERRPYRAKVLGLL